MSEDPGGGLLVLLESRFNKASITGQLSLCHKLLSAIPRVMLTNFRDIYINMLALNPYNVLKEALHCRMASSEEKRIQLLPSGIQLRNLGLSQSLQQMRALVGNVTLGDTVPCQIWLQRLPP
ncbi:unnamed protein product [Echinostoma caproni]|uniref:Ubiquitin-like domain-containing protein n=1 Tax=Echinostoma caproni TaxID=27848 RepID=A0A183BC12_9TREM|nr:unnamed protein product [Echinostoma caproni]